MRAKLNLSLLALLLLPSLGHAAPPNTTTVPTTLQNTPCTAVQLLYGAGAGNNPACLNLGTGLSITTGTLNATGAVAGPGSSTSGDLAIWNNTSGTLLKDQTLTATIDAAIGSTQGSVLYRSATAWTALTPGTSGYSLVTQGGSANPIWSNVAGATGCTVSGGSQYNILTNNGSSGCSSDANTLLNAGSLTLGGSGTVGVVVLGNATSGLLTIGTVTGALGSPTASFPANTGIVAELNLAQTWSAAQSFTDGDLLLKGSSSGAMTLKAPAAASSYVITFPAATDTVAVLGTAQSWGAAQTFPTSDIIMGGSSSGVTTFASANAGASNFTITFPAATGTVALAANANVISVSPTDSSLTISPTAGAVSAALNVANPNTWTATQTLSGASHTFAASIKNAKEPGTVLATTATGTINFDIGTQSILYYTSNATGTWVLNFRFDSATTLDSLMSAGDTVTGVFEVTQGASGASFYNTSVQVNGSTSGVTTVWQGGAPAAGNASGIDVYAYAITKTGSATFEIFATLTQFK